MVASQSETLKCRLRRALLEDQPRRGRELLEQVEPLLPERSAQEAQLLALSRVLLYEDDFTNEEMLARLEQALALTCDGTLPQEPTCQEILLLNHIALCRCAEGQKDRAIAMLEDLAAYYRADPACPEESLRIQPMVLYNLSKYLALGGQYHRCVDVCDWGIALARHTGYCGYLGRMLYNRGWALLRMEDPENRAGAMENLRQAYQLACILQREGEAEHVRGFWESNFTEKL